MVIEWQQCIVGTNGISVFQLGTVRWMRGNWTTIKPFKPLHFPRMFQTQTRIDPVLVRNNFISKLKRKNIISVYISTGQRIVCQMLSLFLITTLFDGHRQTTCLSTISPGSKKKFMPVPWTHPAALSVSHASCSSHFKRTEFHFNEPLAASYPLIFLKRRFREEKFGIWFFSFRSFQDVSRYTDTSGLNLQVMSQLGLMTCSGLVTSTSG